MGIVNVTPDSFSDGGRFADADAAVEHGLALVAAGADVLDVGGESTRPGAEPVPVEEEQRRVLPVIDRLVGAAGVPISVDTTKAAVAAAALDAGAAIVNDVSAGRFDPDLPALVAERRAGYVVMHMQGEPRTMQVEPRYADVVGEVGAFLEERLDVARRAGISDVALCADPGIGFGKDLDHNLTLLARLPELVRRVRVPLLVGTSRKSFLGVVGRPPGEPSLPVDERTDPTLATVVWALDRGASLVRVHDVAPAATAIRLLEAMKAAA
jgi:dihydropteroate synthase